jgi:hypothetical protein
MNDTNQIIKALHDKADAELDRDLTALFRVIGEFAGNHRAITWTEYPTGSADGKQARVDVVTAWLKKVMREACQTPMREKEVAAFMARVARVTDEIDEIRAIAEQQQQ